MVDQRTIEIFESCITNVLLSYGEELDRFTCSGHDCYGSMHFIVQYPGLPTSTCETHLVVREEDVPETTLEEFEYTVREVYEEGRSELRRLAGKMGMN